MEHVLHQVKVTVIQVCMDQTASIGRAMALIITLLRCVQRTERVMERIFVFVNQDLVITCVKIGIAMACSRVTHLYALEMVHALHHQRVTAIQDTMETIASIGTAMQYS
jgi:uncharacterized protein YoaH (UPF0181 family)